MKKEKITYKEHKKVSGIYFIEWYQNGCFYIGQSVDIYARKKGHLSDLKRNTHGNSRLQNNYNKYGCPSFYVIDICERPLLTSREQYWINKFIENKNMCNIEKVCIGVFMSEEGRRHLSALKKGTILSEEHKEKISIGLKSAYKNGRVSNFKGNFGDKNHFYGKKHTQETLNTLSIKRKGLLVSGRNGRSVVVINKNTGIFYECMKDAAESINMPATTFRKKIKNKYFTFIKV